MRKSVRHCQNSTQLIRWYPTNTPYINCCVVQLKLWNTSWRRISRTGDRATSEKWATSEIENIFRVSIRYIETRAEVGERVEVGTFLCQFELSQTGGDVFYKISHERWYIMASSSHHSVCRWQTFSWKCSNNCMHV